MGGSGKERVFVSKESVYQSRVLADFRENRINRKTAAGLLNLSERQITRLSKRFEKGGLLGIQHKTLGTKSNRATEEKQVAMVRGLFTEKYVNFNYSHFKEMLARFEGSLSVIPQSEEF